MKNTFSLEFRSSEGSYLFEIQGEFAFEMFNKIKLYPEFKHTTRKIVDKGEFVVLECVKDCGYLMGGVINFILKKGDYIKCVMGE
jgi:hypothetical protein